MSGKYIGSPCAGTSLVETGGADHRIYGVETEGEIEGWRSSALRRTGELHVGQTGALCSTGIALVIKTSYSNWVHCQDRQLRARRRPSAPSTPRLPFRPLKSHQIPEETMECTFGRPVVSTSYVVAPEYLAF